MGVDMNLSSLKLKFLPVTVVVFWGACMYSLDRFVPAATLEIPYSKAIAYLILATGFIFIAIAGINFQRNSTTVDPSKPDKASTLVRTGIYAYTRNPMYVGMLLALVAWAFALSNVLSFILIPFFIEYMTRFQIRPEEEILLEKFGSEFEDYCNSVRRWI